MIKFLFSFILIVSNVYSQNQNCFINIGILVPMKKESTYLRKQIKNKKNVVINNIRFTKGEIAGHHIIFQHSGVGKINAAIATTDLIKEFHPDIVLMSGAAGNLNKNIYPKDIVIGTELINVDLGRLTAKGPFLPKRLMNNSYFNQQIDTRLKLDPNLKNLISKMKFSNQFSKVYFGRIATSDIDPNPASQAKLLRGFGVDFVDMEGAAFMQSCYLYKTPCIVIRGASDFIDPDTKAIDLQAGKSSSKTLIEIIQQLPKCPE
jgi:adenosylhomocysteine nucleosidase